jgi:hypothetical protein
MRGSAVRFVLYSSACDSHRTLRIVLRQDGRAGRLEVACIGPEFIHGPVQWQEAHIGVTFDGNAGFVVSDAAADVNV